MLNLYPNNDNNDNADETEVPALPSLRNTPIRSISFSQFTRLPSSASMTMDGHPSRYLSQQYDTRLADPLMDDATEEVDYNSPENQLDRFLQPVLASLEEEATLAKNKEIFVTQFELQLAQPEIMADFLVLLANYMHEVQLGKKPHDEYFALVRTEANYILGLFAAQGETNSWSQLLLLVKDALMQKFCDDNLDATTDHPEDKIYLEKERYDELYEIFNIHRGRWAFTLFEARHAEKFRQKFAVSPPQEMFSYTS